VSVSPAAADDAASDAALMRVVQEGRSDRFALLVERYERPLLRVAYSRLGRVDWAEDAVQETFLSAFKSAHTFNPQYSFRTWLWTILLNQCRTSYRRRARDERAQLQVTAWDGPFSIEASSEHTSRRLVSDEPAPLDRLLAKERTAQIEAMLVHLSEVQADALRLRFFGGLKFNEIAQTMGCSLSTAKNRVRWGLTKLTEMIGELPDEARRDLAPTTSCSEEQFT
jgi:RNA polymerase sigma-70 factor (ECF subfamily)